MLGGRLLQFRLWVSAESELLSSPINKTALFLFTTWWGPLVHSGAEQVMHHAAVPALSCSHKRWIALLSYLWLSSRCTPNTFRWLLRLSEFCISRKFLSQDRFEHRCTILPAGPWQPGTACCPPPGPGCIMPCAQLWPCLGLYLHLPRASNLVPKSFLKAKNYAFCPSTSCTGLSLGPMLWFDLCT